MIQTDREIPLVSVLLAVFNGQEYLLDALASVERQPHRPLEIIVIDDGSTDATVDIVRAFAHTSSCPVRYIFQPNQGQAAALNAGLQSIQGTVVGFIDADDLWTPDKLTVQLPHLQPTDANHKRPGIVLGHKHHFVDKATVDPRLLAEANARAVHFALGSSLFARWVFDVVGLFDTDLRHGTDWDWYLRARALEIPMIELPITALFGRVHQRNVTRQREVEARFVVRMVRRHLQRQQNNSFGIVE